MFVENPQRCVGLVQCRIRALLQQGQSRQLHVQGCALRMILCIFVFENRLADEEMGLRCIGVVARQFHIGQQHLGFSFSQGGKLCRMRNDQHI